MKRISALVLVMCLTISLPLHAGGPAPAPSLTADDILEKNAAARGGLEAWKKIQTLVWVGHIENGQVAAPSLPFILKLKRPNKTRFEITAQNQMLVRLFDGSQGWKLRPTGSGNPDLQPYTEEELSFARDGQGGIDGPLMDHEAKGIVITLDGVDEVEEHKAYRMNVELPSGARQHVWIDAQTFLEIKSDRKSSSAMGQSTVSVFYHNYRTIEGLQIPLIVESRAGTNRPTDKMVIDRVLINPPLEDYVFIKPNLPHRRNTVTVNTAPAPDSGGVR